MNKNEDVKEESLLTKWLNKLQEESWNLELIISGFSIFGLFQILENIELKAYRFTASFEKSDAMYSTFSNMLNAVYIGLIIFIVCLLIHVFLRGLWIGAIGLRYVSGNIDYDGLKYNDRFKNHLSKRVGNFDDFILRLERISSSIFALTYLLFFILLSFIIYIIWTGLVGQGLFTIFGNKLGVLTYQIIIYSILFFGIVVALDFLTLGSFKRIKARWFTRIYFPIYIFISYVTLSFLWRPLLYNFIDQKHTKWMAAAMVPFLLFLYIFLISYYNVYQFYPWKNTKEDAIFNSINYKENSRYTFDPEFYDDLRTQDREQKKYSVIQVMSIPKYKVNSSILEVFVKYDKRTEDVVKAMDSTIVAINDSGMNLFTMNTSSYNKQKDGRFKKMIKDLNSQKPQEINASTEKFVKNEQVIYRKNLEKLIIALKNAYSFEVNGSPIAKDSMDIIFYTHTNFGEKGFICNFLISNKAKEGTNYLSLKKKFYQNDNNAFEELDFTIPFIYVK